MIISCDNHEIINWKTTVFSDFARGTILLNSSPCNIFVDKGFSYFSQHHLDFDLQQRYAVAKECKKDNLTSAIESFETMIYNGKGNLKKLTKLVALFANKWKSRAVLF